MLTLSAKIRKGIGKKTKTLRKKNMLPAVLYGPGIKNFNLKLDLKEFERVYKEAGETSLISLLIEGEKTTPLKTKEFMVLIHDVQHDPLTENPIHVDFYQPKLKKEIEVTLLLIFEGEAPAVKELGGTLVRNISELKVKAKPKDLPKELKVNINSLKTFEDSILIQDLKVPEGVKILKEPEEIVALVSPPEKLEEEMEKPVEEKVEEVEKMEEKEEKEEEPEPREIKK